MVRARHVRAPKKVLVDRLYPFFAHAKYFGHRGKTENFMSMFGGGRKHRVFRPPPQAIEL